MKPYKLVAQENGTIPAPISIGPGNSAPASQFVLISGPCSVESKEQVLSIASSVKKSRRTRAARWRIQAAHFALSFQGLGEDGLRFLAEARAETGLPIITEIMDTRDLPIIEKYADCLQIGARSMQNFSLLKEVGRSRLPVLLKRGLSATIYRSTALSAEYILERGQSERPSLRTAGSAPSKR